MTLPYERATSEKVELLPCPFCGEKAEYESFEGAIIGEIRWSVGCNNSEVADCMGYQSLQSFSTRTEARTAWNTRTPNAESVTEPDLAKLYACIVDISTAFEQTGQKHPYIADHADTIAQARAYRGEK